MYLFQFLAVFTLRNVAKKTEHPISVKTMVPVKRCSKTPKNLIEKKKRILNFRHYFSLVNTKNKKSYFGFSPGAADSDSFLRLIT